MPKTTQPTIDDQSPAAVRRAAIEATLARNTAATDEVKNLFSASAFALVDDPNNTTIKQELASLQTELDALERERKIHVAGLEVAIRADSREGRAVAYRALEGEMQKVLALNPKAATLLNRVVDHLALIGPDLMALAAVLEDREHAVGNIVNGTTDSLPTRSRAFESLAPLVRCASGGVLTALVDAVYQTGIGRVAIDLTPHVSVSQPGIAFRRTACLEVALAENNDRIIEMLEKLMAAKAAELGIAQ